MKSGRPPKEVSADLAERAWLLRVEEHLSYRKIAQRLHVTPKTARLACIRQREENQRQFRVQAAYLMDEHTERLDTIFERAMTDYKKGKKRTTVVCVRERRAIPGKTAGEEGEGGSSSSNSNSNDEGQLRERVTETKIRLGKANPALLGQARGALRDIREIWGVHIATKQQPGSIGYDYLDGYDEDGTCRNCGQQAAREFFRRFDQVLFDMAEAGEMDWDEVHELRRSPEWVACARAML
jgi:hypothetical protein